MQIHKLAGEATTVGLQTTVLASYAVLPDATCLGEAQVVVLVSGVDRGVFTRQVLFYRMGVAGLTQQHGSNIINQTISSNLALHVDFVVNGNNIELQATGAAGQTVIW